MTTVTLSTHPSRAVKHRRGHNVPAVYSIFTNPVSDASVVLLDATRQTGLLFTG
jgi:hypothetical protein